MNELRKIWSRILGIEKRLKDGDEIIIVDALPTHPVEGVFYQFNNNFYHYVNGAWQTAVYVPGDVSELTDTTGVIPHASGDLTDGADLSKAYVGTPLNATRASATLEFDGSGTSVVAGKTVTIKDKVYTYVDALTVAPGVEGEVLIGADDTEAMANLYMAIDDIGVSYGLTHWCTVNADVKFKEYDGADGMTIEARTAGLAGNTIAVSTDIENAEWQNSGNVLTTALVGGINATIGKVGDRYFPPADPTHFWVAVADNGLTDENWVLTDVKYENFIIADRATLEVLVAGNLLEVGKDYLLSDFAQSYNIFDGGTMEIFEEKVGALEPLILKAIATNKFDKVAISPLRPNDIIHYSFDILDIRDIGFGNGVDTVNANFKGMIYYRKDTVQNNECHYNFVPTYGVEFRRWAVDAVAFDNRTAYAARNVCKASDGKIYKCIADTAGEGDPTVNTADWVLWLDITADAFVSWTSDTKSFNIGDIHTSNLIINNVTAGVDYDDFYTFGDYYKWVYDVSLGSIMFDYMYENYNIQTMLASHKVFKTVDNNMTCYKINFGVNCLPMTFQSSCNTLKFNDENSLMIFGYNNSQIKFGSINSSIIFGNGNSSMTFGNSNSSMIFRNLNQSIRFGNFNKSMTFGDSNSSITFGHNSNPENTAITFGNGNTMCIFEDKCFTGLAADLDLTAATHIRGAYNTTIYQDKTDGVKLSYMDGGVMQIVDVTD